MTSPPLIVRPVFEEVRESEARNPVRVWRQDENGRVHTPLEPVVLGATLCLIPVFILEFDGAHGSRLA